MIYNLNTKDFPALSHKSTEQLNLESYNSQKTSISAFPIVKSETPLRFVKSAVVKSNNFHNFLDFGPSGLEIQPQDDLFKKIRYILIFGRFIGVIPCKGALQSDYRRFEFV